MLRNYLVTALRNLMRNKLYAGITILGLAAAFTAAILIGQFVRSELTYDHWIPGYQRIYKITDILAQPGQPPTSYDTSPPPLAGQLKAVFPGIEAIARLDEAFPPVKAKPGDEAETDRSFAWADPDIFKALPLPALAGNLDTALQRPDTVVITRNLARHYFHRDLPIGETLLVQTTPRGQPGAPPPQPAWHPMRVTAVLKDLPSNTNLVTEAFASSRSAYSEMAIMDAGPPAYGALVPFTFVRLKPGVTAGELQRALDVATGPERALAGNFAAGAQFLFKPLALGEAHLNPTSQTAIIAKSAGSKPIAYGVAGVGALIVLVAAINFVTLMTARAARRGVEVGVRKATGATQGDLMAQFIGEALLQVAFATLIAAALAEALIKPFSAFLQRDLTLDYLRDPAVPITIVAVALMAGLMAAIYPALVLSSFRPAAVLKGGVVSPSRSSPSARTALVVVQFAVLVCLIATTVTIWRQTQYALTNGLGGDTNRLLVAVVTPCNGPFNDEALKLPGVAGAACSSYNAMNMPGGQNHTSVQLGGRRSGLFVTAPLDFGLLDLFDVKPLAGRLFLRDHGEDGVLRDPKTHAQPTVILNQSAAKALGFTDPRAAVGQQMSWSRGRPGDPPGGPAAPAPSRIVGVVPDMPATVRVAAEPTFYYVDPGSSFFVILRLKGQDMPGTIKAIADTWKRTNAGQPFNELLLGQFRLNQYHDLVVQGVTIAVCAGLAVLIACLGLFALSAYTTERRTKEIGVRKAMGANTGDVVLLLLWQFTVPVLIATAVAIPLGAVAMNWWLHGFVYHTPLSAWVFVLAAASGVAIAWLTVSWQSWAVAKAKPAGALRYE